MIVMGREQFSAPEILFKVKKLFILQKFTLLALIFKQLLRTKGWPNA